MRTIIYINTSLLPLTTMVEPAQLRVEQYIQSKDGKYQIYHHMWKVKKCLFLFILNF